MLSHINQLFYNGLIILSIIDCSFKAHFFSNSNIKQLEDVSFLNRTTFYFAGEKPTPFWHSSTLLLHSPIRRPGPKYPGRGWTAEWKFIKKVMFSAWQSSSPWMLLLSYTVCFLPADTDRQPDKSYHTAKNRKEKLKRSVSVTYSHWLL